MIALLAFFLFGSFSIVSQSSNYQKCTYNYQQEDKNNPEIKKSLAIKVRCSLRVIDQHNGAVTALATIVIAIFTIFLAIISHKQTALTKDALVADKRAFVYCSGFKQLYEKDAKTKMWNWRFRPNWYNSGDTPTKNMVTYSQCILSNNPISDDFNFDHIAPSTSTAEGIIPPNFGVCGGLAPLFPLSAITPQDILDVQAGKKFLYLLGWVKYHDVFERTPQHITRFCWNILITGNPKTFVPGSISSKHQLIFEYLHHPYGNCADDECCV